MHQLRCWALVLTVAIACGCSSGFVPEGPTAPQNIGSLAGESMGVVASATGHGQFESIDPIFGGPDLRKFSFSANKLADGRVSGQFQLVFGSGDRLTHGHVTCLTVIDNEAWIGVVIDRNNVGAPVPRPAVFGVADNGAGTGDPADAITNLFPGVNPEPFCAETPDLGPFLRPIEDGDISVR